MRNAPALHRHPVALPLLVWACAAVSVALVAAVHGYPPWESSTWARWDSGLYEDVARDGYQLFPCESEPDTWCGDAAWLPGYPWLFGSLHRLGLPLRGSGVVVSWVLAAGTIVLLWATFLERRAGSAVAAALLYAAFAPGQIYHYAVFPLSLLAFSTVACLWLLCRDRFVLAGIAGAVAALAYPVGVLLAPIAAAWLFLQRNLPLAERARRSAITGGLTLAGFGVFMLDQRLETGRWEAFFLVQEKYAPFRTSLDPLETTWSAIRTGFENAGDSPAFAVGVQATLVTTVLAVVLLHAFRRRRSLDRTDSLLLIWALATWALPLSQSVSIQRGEAALLPLAVLVGRLPPRLAWALAGASVVVAVLLEKYFLDGTIV
jgi:hypothetical protein